MRGALMVCGTSSDAGKSHLVTALCRVLHRQGVRVAPFKAQNMALNSFVTPSGHEIGRAQGIQALAAGAEPDLAMNPILLKPTGERTSQVVVLGRPHAHLDAVAYQAEKPRLRHVVLAALADLRSRYDVVLLEGAGSPAEINLLEHDLVNLGVADAADVPAVVVGDIDRGGVFAALYGTVALLPDQLRARVKGFVINKFRGDPSLLAPALTELEQRCGVPTLGVLPWVDGVALDAEDSLALAGPRPAPGRAAVGDGLDVAVVRLPRISNFTDFDALALEPGVTVRMVASADDVGDPDLLVLPGTKATVADLEWLRGRGLHHRVERIARRATVMGICGGYQMLGTTIVDRVESGRGTSEGLALLPVATRFHAHKVTRQRRGRAMEHAVSGYEIHHGEMRRDDGAPGWVELDDAYGTEAEGAARTGDVTCVGTSLHGLFEQDGFRAAFLAQVAHQRGKRFVPAGVSFAAAREAQFDRLADLVETHLDLRAVEALIAGAALPTGTAA